MEDKIRFVHISDTHIGSSPDFFLYGKNTLQSSHYLIDEINSMNAPVDFVIHAGDVTNRPDDLAIVSAHETFSRLKVPIHYTIGNHDSKAIIDKTLHSTTHNYFEDTGSYWFEQSGISFLFLDTQGPPEIDPHGQYLDIHDRIVCSFLKNANSPVCITTHFPALPLDSPWIDRDMLLLNGELFHKRLVHSPSPVLCVLFGHVHKRVTMTADGILYCSAPSSFCQFSILPSDQSVGFEPNLQQSFNYITLSKSGVLVKEHSFLPK